MAENFHGAREIVAQSILEALAPTRRFRRESAHGKANRGEIEARVEAAAAVETDLLSIQLVKVMEDTADREPFVVVERMFEDSHRHGAAVEHEVFADQTAGIRETVGELLVGG